MSKESKMQNALGGIKAILDRPEEEKKQLLLQARTVITILGTRRERRACQDAIKKAK